MSSKKLFAVFFVSFFLFGCVSQSNFESRQTGSADNVVVSSSNSAVVDVAIKDFNFSKNDLFVLKGTTIRWTNFDSAVHEIVSYGLFDSKVLENGKSFSFTFAKPGEYYYLCILHPEMIGKIKVE
jgi:plastocyanin